MTISARAAGSVLFGATSACRPSRGLASVSLAITMRTPSSALGSAVAGSASGLASASVSAGHAAGSGSDTMAPAAFTRSASNGIGRSKARRCRLPDDGAAFSAAVRASASSAADNSRSSSTRRTSVRPRLSRAFTRLSSSLARVGACGSATAFRLRADGFWAFSGASVTSSAIASTRTIGSASGAVRSASMRARYASSTGGATRMAATTRSAS